MGERTARRRYRASFSGMVVAESDDVEIVEGNVYFPRSAIRSEHFTMTQMRTVCPWKGVARYFTVEAGGNRSRNAAWTYQHPFLFARRVKGHVAFWGRVQVTEFAMKD